MMKKFIVALIFISSVIVSAQNKKFSLGVALGVNQAQLSKSDLSYRTDFFAYIQGAIKFSEMYILQPEIGYSQQGGKSKNSAISNLYTKYISIAITNKLTFKNTGFSITLSPGVEFDIDDTFINLMNRSEGNDVTFVDIFIAPGVRYDFKNGLGLFLRYKQGLIDVFDGDFHTFSGNPTYKNKVQLNQVFQLGVAYKFNFKK